VTLRRNSPRPACHPGIYALHTNRMSLTNSLLLQAWITLFIVVEFDSKSRSAGHSWGAQSSAQTKTSP
jgi:hypothetical protein